MSVNLVSFLKFSKGSKGGNDALFSAEQRTCKVHFYFQCALHLSMYFIICKVSESFFCRKYYVSMFISAAESGSETCNVWHLTLYLKCTLIHVHAAAIIHSAACAEIWNPFTVEEFYRCRMNKCKCYRKSWKNYEFLVYFEKSYVQEIINAK